MCGIFGIVTQSEQNLGPILVEAARRLTYRGYDSVGAAVISGSRIDLRKDKGRVDEVAEKYRIAEMTGQRGITQLRWATFGVPSQVNAQPHLDSDGDLVGAHNGNVVNNVELRQEFAAEGMVVRSENDGESCVHAVERYINRGFGFVDAIRAAYNDLQGDYAFVIGRVNDDKLYAIKKGSGLVVGLGDGFTCVSSDLPSILPLTRKVVRLNDGDVVCLRWDGVDLYSVADGNLITREPEIVTEEMSAVQKGGYAHFMLKEIHEQPQVARELLHLLKSHEDVAPILEAVRAARNLYLIGCGTSYHACLAGSVFFARLAGRAAVPVLAPQFIPQYAPTVGPEDVGIFVSQSGETKDVLNALEQAQKRGMQCFSLANVIGSTLTKVTSAWLPLACGYEISVPATKTFTNQVITFLYLAGLLGGGEPEALDPLPDLMEQAIRWTDPQVKALAEDINGWNDLYSLGFGSTYAMALEGALKLKEITYAHCEGMLSTEFKHGPLSAVTDGFPVLFSVSSEDVPLIVSGINEVSCRGGRAIAIGQEDSRLNANASDVITIPPSDSLFAPLLAVIPLQLLSYYMAVGRGYDPDFPRNLSKTLTVD
ncbi:MAG: glutamine--fructose-6-phosphate transaminase (isomerizing) [Chloroflexi bacterium]|jgi:glucosamine--fructose-6-phosphate aminotransferase (isomerizing)|nr:glutamine--fructose-6-phosphate transaminase (isomerizing) [Anaerolineaceae bacterium]NLI44044.1 glutamine--fructose-6-phosphate transaminase (isomerizing) [Chloroflexota bacterium]HOE34234.1 glutamine--fructose-6-phosphate transaminase (isomerizing) [Anaerolineaceae bacterium]HOT25821.1 glutamine--fructose-6-phosphate transaminase (isomerizing) [Anaerolineaceae bacterium]HQH58232.1 glutamine--fructose-6-phosphate transaminase (isomerizing) [Anaerolineaceae bacterium]